MGSPIFRKITNTGKRFGQIINSQPVSTISNNLISGGNIATKVLNNPEIQGLAMATPEGALAYGTAKALAKGSIQAGNGIQRLKKAVNASPFKPTYAQ